MYFNTTSYEWCHNWLGFEYFCGSPKTAVGRKDMNEERDTHIFIYLFIYYIYLFMCASCWSVRPSVRLYVRMEQLGSLWKDFH